MFEKTFDYFTVGTSLILLILGVRFVTYAALLVEGAVPTDSTTLGQALGLLVLIVGFVFQQISRRQDKAKEAQDRADRILERDAAITVSNANRDILVQQADKTTADLRVETALANKMQLDELIAATEAQTRELTARVRENQDALAAVAAQIHQSTTTAMDVANDVNHKLIATTERVDQALRIVGDLHEPVLERTPNTVLQEVPVEKVPS